MCELLQIFKKLSEYFINGTLWEDVEDIFENVQSNRNSADGQQIYNENLQKLMSMPLIQRAVIDEQIIATLLELCVTIRTLRNDANGSYDNTFDCWDQVIKVAPRDSFLAFIYTLASLMQLDSSSPIYIKLSILAANAYFLSLTIPGAKGFHIFEEEIVTHCLQVFSLIDRLQNPDVISRMKHHAPIQIWLQFSTLCDDLKIVFRYVHFKDNKDALDAVLTKLINIQYLNHERGYANKYAVDVHVKCFEIYEEIINAHNGEPEESLLKIMNMTVFLHTYPAKPKSLLSTNITTDTEHISDWFIKSISKYPRLLTKILNFYIDCVVTNPVESWKSEQIQKSLEYAAKYDAAMFTKCNESCVEFLCDAVYADEVMIRSRAVDLISKILQMESHVDWQMFRHEVSNIPREIHLIKELIDSFQDQNNNIKLKSVQGLYLALTKGSPNARKILTECIRYVKFYDTNIELPDEPQVDKDEIRFEKPDEHSAQYTFEGHGMIEMSVLNLPSYIYMHLFQSPLSYIRRAGIMLMEQIVKLNPLIIFNTNFVTEMARLVDEPTALVRKQTLLSIDSILECYPNCYPAVWVWCKIITPMMQDADTKNIDVALECFRSRVLANLKSIEQTNKAEHYMPWVIIRTLLSTQSRLYLQNCFHKALQPSMLTSQMVDIIESHLLASNSTEAWVVLNFIADKIRSKEPDALVHHFMSLKSWDKEENMFIALEVLASCIKDLSHTALNYAFKHILTQIKEGKVLPAIIGKAFDFLVIIDNRSNTTSKNRNGAVVDLSSQEWLLELHQYLENELLNGIQYFPDNSNTFLSHMYAYSEVNLQSRLRPHQTIVLFIHKYMSVCLKLTETDMHPDNIRLFNSMILIAGRLSLRDGGVAATTCALYAQILHANDHPAIVNTIIVSTTDLCKKHPHVVERITERVLRKLKSPYAVNRLETFKCFEKLVLQDQLKLRGSLLLTLLSALLDECVALSNRAAEFFAEFVAKKNSTLFQKCLIECPYVFNEYKNFDGLDSFSEAHIKSPLKGESKQKQRQYIYVHLMSDMDDINMIAYFGQLKLIAEKSKADPLIKEQEGIALVKDVLYILKKVCQLTKEQKNSSENNDAESKEEDVMAEINELAEGSNTEANAASTNNSSNKNTNATGPGRGRRKRELTMPEAMSLLEKSLIFIPTIFKNIHEYDSSLQKSFDDLCNALSKRFPNLVDYAQPAEFWNKYRKSKIVTGKSPAKGKSPKKSRRKPKKDTSEDENSADVVEVDDVNDAESVNDDNEGNVESDSDDELLICKKVKMSTKNKEDVTFSQLSMDYIFNPNI